MKHIGEMLAQKQLDAYNKQDLEQFLSVYSNEVIIMEFPSNNVTSRGIEEMRLRYGKLFKENPNNKAELVSRILFENKVIDHEFVTGRANGMDKYAVAIYEIEKGKICKVWFM